MKNLKYVVSVLAVGLLLINVSCSKDDEVENPAMHISVPTEGNSWFFLNPDSPNPQVWDVGAQSWTNPEAVKRTWFWLRSGGELHLGFRGRAESGTSVLLARFGDTEKEIALSGDAYEEVYLGTFDIQGPGYYYLDLQGVSRESLDFAQVPSVVLGGSATQAGVYYVNEDYFYWGRRGPSVHLGYGIPPQAGNVRWFYNELHIPEGSDVIGSFFMANGFRDGYFGMQVNSGHERRVLFSVWSPYDTDFPDEIPDDQRVELLRKGEGVIAQDFGHEGSGGQSYLVYNWQVGQTYRFLLKGEPSGDNKTDYTAYFHSPDEGEWRLIASWRRPLTNRYLQNIHSFLENFVTSTGALPREGHYNNQWVKDTSGQWHELTTATFTADATARDNARLDYAGGQQQGANGFFMKNCGFFSDNTAIDSQHSRTPLGIPPDIDLSELP